MDLKTAFQTLEIREGASEKEVRQAYRDMVSVWHPDRFSGNPRLKKRAEEKVKEANAAYETLKTFHKGGEGRAGSSEKSREEKDGRKGNQGGGESSRTEWFAETGTEVVLTLWAHLSEKITGSPSGKQGGGLGGKLGRIFSDSGNRR